MPCPGRRDVLACAHLAGQLVHALIPDPAPALAVRQEVRDHLRGDVQVQLAAVRTARLERESAYGSPSWTTYLLCVSSSGVFLSPDPGSATVAYSVILKMQIRVRYPGIIPPAAVPGAGAPIRLRRWPWLTAAAGGQPDTSSGAGFPSRTRQLSTTAAVARATEVFRREIAALHDLHDRDLAAFRELLEARIGLGEIRLDDLKALLDERYASQTRTFEEARATALESVRAALSAAETAVNKAEMATEKRFESVE